MLIWCLGSIVLVEYLHNTILNTLRQEQRSYLSQQLALVRANIEAELNANIYLVDSLATIISVTPNSNAEEWSPLASVIMQKTNSIRNIAIAPNNIVQFVYPLAGNEAVLGFNYRDSAEQLRTVEYARSSKNAFIAGPLTLVQGGTAVIVRIPVFSYIDQHYWGTCSVVIDIDKLFSSSGLRNLQDQVAVAIRGKDATGEAGAIFLGEESTFSQAFAQESIRLISGSWHIAIAEPRAQRAEQHMLLSVIIRFIGYGLFIALFILLFSLYYAYRLAHLTSLQDHLTLLPNRRFATQLLNNLIQHRTPFTILSLDLDKFKQVNDRFGHATGDALLQEVANRLIHSIRSADCACRISGDEFLLVLPRLSNLADIQRIIDKLTQHFSAQPFNAGHHQIPIHFSLGYAIYPQHADNLEALLNYADLAMYQHKQQPKDKLI